MEPAPLIHDVWYVAAPSSKVAGKQMLAKTMAGQALVLGRDASGAVFALRDFCPHRGMPLRYGSFDGCQVECCYHGWRFDTGGRCTEIPSLSPGENVDLSRIRVASYPCAERGGLIWVYLPPPGSRAPGTLPPLPEIGDGLGFRTVESVILPCHIDHAVIGLMDPAHGPFVHRSWWWRTRRSMHQKEKRFAPHGLGFRMLSHAPSSNSRAYRILGGGRTTEITFELPGLRSEHIRLGGGRRNIVLLTALTPLDHARTELQQFIATDIGWVKLLLPLLKRFGRAFIAQDRDVVEKQQEGLRAHPAAGLMLLGDADQQALWYHKLKRDWLKRDRDDPAPFVNRVPEKTLRWRS